MRDPADIRDSHRFAIDITGLEHESYGLLRIGLLIGILFHCALAFVTVQIGIIEREDDALHHTVPIILKTIPSPPWEAYRLPRRRIAPRKMRRQTFSPVQPSRNAAVQPGLAGERISMSVPGAPGAVSVGDETGDVFTPDGVYDAVAPHIDLSAGRTPERHVSLTDDVIDIDALDTGQYKGLIIRDPSDRHNVKGFIHVPLRVYGEQYSTPEKTALALRNLGTFIFNTHTGVEFKYDQHVLLSSNRLNTYPFLYLPIPQPLNLSKRDAKNIGRYLENGGFALFQFFSPGNLTPEEKRIIDRHKRDFVNAILPGRMLDPLPFNHPVFSTYYDIYDIDQKRMSLGLESERVISGVTTRDRLVLIDSSGMGEEWLSILGSNGRNKLTPPGNPKAWRMGINSIIYALIHNESAAIQLTDGSTVTSQIRRNSWQWNHRENYLDEERSAANRKWDGK